MPLSLNEIKARALAFSREWEGAKAERADTLTSNDGHGLHGQKE